jgi:hypothetical protein
VALMRKCRNPDCRKKFAPVRSTLEQCCSPECAIAWSRTDAGQRFVEQRKRREARAAKAAFREKHIKLSELKQKAQDAFNAWIRERDRNFPCVSCGRFDLNDPLTGGGWDAGHFRTVGACPQLRYEPDNCHRQCKHCNKYRAQSVEHRLGVLARIGSERLSWIEGHHPEVKWDRDQLRAIEAHYKSELKILQQQRKAA